MDLKKRRACLAIRKNVRILEMAEAVITSKGQITIPAEIRKKINLGPQDKFVFNKDMKMS